MEKANNLLLKLLGLLLLIAAVMKGYQLLTEPVANKDIWTNRAFMIFTVEFEIALGIWLLSGIFKKLTWLAATACFSIFCCVTLYKALAGYGSCGCFGNVHVNPWITLFVIDLPAVIALIFVKPNNICNIIVNAASSIYGSRAGKDAAGAFNHSAKPSLTVVSSLEILLILTSSIVLAINKPAVLTSSYEILEPETWIGKELPILEHIDIANQLKTGDWLVVLYHHDCPTCVDAIPKIEQMARDLEGNENFLRIALIEVPPYGKGSFGVGSANTSSELGKLNATKEWFVTTPATILTENNNVLYSWDERVPVLEELMNIRAQTKDRLVSTVEFKPKLGRRYLVRNELNLTRIA